MKKQLQKLMLLSMLAVIGCSAPLKAQSLFKDLIPGANPYSSNPAEYMNVGNTMYFICWAKKSSSPAYTYQLWKSDGTAGNTVLVKDSIPTSYNSGDVHFVASAGNYVYYLFRQDGNGYIQQLWKSDGTTAGTGLVATLTHTNAAGCAAPANFTTVGNTIFFQFGPAGGNGNELWKTDGTAAGTMEVTDLNPNSSGGAPLAGADNKPMMAYNGKIYFSGSTSGNNYELFCSDGTAAGTTLVQEINPGTINGSNPNAFNVVNNELYFIANTGTGSQNRLFKTDGTTTTQLSSVLSELTLGFKNEVYFRGSGRDLWKSDGTVAGTVMVKDSVIYAGNFLGANGNYLFVSYAKYNGIAPTYYDYRYYRCDGTTAGITRISYDIAKTVSNQQIGNNMYFTHYDSATTKVSLYVTDGTTAGTHTLLTQSGSYDAPGTAQVFGNDVFFSRYDAATGGELWHLGATAGISTIGRTDNEVNAYPNPSKGFFTVASQGVSEMQVFNNLGQLMLSITFEGQTEISGLAAGIYHLQIKNKAGVSSRKMIIAD